MNYVGTLPSPPHHILFGVPTRRTVTVVAYRCTVASVQRRIQAELIDFLLLMVVKYMIFHMLGEDQQKIVSYFLLEGPADSISVDELFKFMVFLFIYWFVVLIYEVGMISFSRDGRGGATIGKMVMKIRVIKAADLINSGDGTITVKPGGDIGVWRAIIRTTFKDVSTAVFFPVFFTLLYTPYRQTSYDVAAGTIVVNKHSHPVLE